MSNTNEKQVPSFEDAELEARKLSKRKQDSYQATIRNCDSIIQICDAECAKAGDKGSDEADMKYACIMDRFGELARRARYITSFAMHANQVASVLGATATMGKGIKLADLNSAVLDIEDTFDRIKRMTTSAETDYSDMSISVEDQARIQRKVMKAKQKENLNAHENFVTTVG